MGSVFRRKIEATEESDVSSILRKLREGAAHAGLSEFAIDALDAQLRGALELLVARGKNLRDIGGRLDAKRKFEGPGYMVELLFRVGERPSLAARIARRLRMR